MYKSRIWSTKYLSALAIIACAADQSLQADLSDLFLTPETKVQIKNKINFAERVYVVVQSDKHKVGPFYCPYGLWRFFDITFRKDRPNVIYAYRKEKPERATERYVWEFALNRQGKQHRIRLDRKVIAPLFGIKKDPIYLVYDYVLDKKRIKDGEKITGTKEKLVNGNWEPTND